MPKQAEVSAADCHVRAAEARRRAESATNPLDRAEFLDLERRWLSLAASYEFVAKTERDLDSIRGQS